MKGLIIGDIDLERTTADGMTRRRMIGMLDRRSLRTEIVTKMRLLKMLMLVKVLLDEQADLQLSDIRSARYTNQFSPIELDRITAAQPDGALWVRFKLQPGKHEQVLRIFAPDLAHLSLYVLDGDTLVEQQSTGTRKPQDERPLPSSDFMLPIPP